MPPEAVTVGAVAVEVCAGTVGAVDAGDGTAVPVISIVVDGLPAPHTAVTVYVPPAEVEITAVPWNCSLPPDVMTAVPPTKADETRPVSALPLFGHVPSRLTVWPGATDDGLTMIWP
jgi:hypothetical protein